LAASKMHPKRLGTGSQFKSYRAKLGYTDLMRGEIAAAGMKGKRLTYRRPHKQSQIEAH
jgi:hypothetical protein